MNKDLRFTFRPFAKPNDLTQYDWEYILKQENPSAHIRMLIKRDSVLGRNDEPEK